MPPRPPGARWKAGRDSGARARGKRGAPEGSDRAGGAAILVDAQEGGIPPCGRSGIDLWNDMDGVHSFSAIRNFADRARGFSCTSASEGVMGLRVMTRTERRCPQIQTGAWGGQIQSVASTLNRFFAILSSTEWKETTPTRPPLASTWMAPFNPFSIASSSRFTAIRNAWKVRVATGMLRGQAPPG